MQKKLVTILVVDDEKEICDLFAGSLAAEGYEVLKAYGGVEAFSLLCKKDHQIDIVISDIKMPDGDGIELLRNIKENEIAVGVFLMTGFSEYDRSELVSMGALEVFKKPMKFSVIFESLEKLQIAA